MNTTELLSKQNVHRGEVYYIMPEGHSYDGVMNGGRPGIIVSNDMNNTCDTIVEVVYLSRHPKIDLPTNVPISSTGVKCWAICGQIQTVSKRRIGKFVNQLDDKEIENVNRAMALGLDSKLNLSMRDIHSFLNHWKDSYEQQPNAPQERKVDSNVEKLRAELEFYKELYNNLLKSLINR